MHHPAWRLVPLVLAASLLAPAPARADSQANYGACNTNIIAGDRAPAGIATINCINIVEGGGFIDNLMRSLRDALGMRDAPGSLPADVAAAIKAPLSPDTTVRLDQLIASHGSQQSALAELYFARGNVAIGQGGPAKGVQDLGRAYLLGNNHPRFALAYAAALVDTGNYAQATQVYADLHSDLDKGRFGPVDEIYRVTTMLGPVQVLMRTLHTGDAYDRDGAVLNQLADMDAGGLEVRKALVAAEGMRIALLLQMNREGEAAEALPALLQRLDQHPEDTPRDIRAMLYLTQADFELNRGRTEGARTAVGKAQAQLADPNGILRPSPAAVMVFITKSSIAPNTNPGFAKTSAWAAVNMAQQLTRAYPAEFGDVIVLLKAQVTLARAAGAEGNEVEAEKAMQDGVAALRDFVGQHQQYRDLLAIALAEAAEFALAHRNPQEAGRTIDEAIATYGATSAPSAPDRRLLMSFLIDSADAREALGQWQDARDAASKALDIARELARSDRAIDPSLAYIGIQIATATGSLGDEAAAETGLDDALATTRAFVQLDPAANIGPSMKILDRICDVGEPHRAAARCGQGVETLRTVPANDINPRALAHLLTRLAAQQSAAAGPEAALGPLQEAEQIQLASLDRADLGARLDGTCQ
jgi:tetratricopeptide (TPR) repeat protein